MSEEQNDYQKMVEEVEANSIQEEIKSKGLGKASMARFTNDVQSGRDLLGWIDVDIAELPSRGAFYPADAKIMIRSAKVAEIRHFSTLDEGNMLDIDEKLNAIVKACSQVSSKTGKFAAKDILEEDRFFLLLSIRDLTFPEPESVLRVSHQTKDGKKHDVEIKREYFQYFEIPDEVQRYYDEETRSYVIKTKSFGTIEMRPPSIGIMEEVTKYIKDRQTKGLNIDQSLLQVMPYIVTDWRNFTQAKMFEVEVEMNGWDHRKYSLIYKLAEQMKVGIKPTMMVTIGDATEEVPIGFRDGLKSLFIVQDITAELL